MTVRAAHGRYRQAMGPGDLGSTGGAVRGSGQTLAMSGAVSGAGAGAGFGVMSGGRSAVRAGSTTHPAPPSLCEWTVAAAKATAILSRGWLALNTAVNGMVWMTVEDSAAASRALMGARTLQEFWDLERCVFSDGSRRSTRRWLVLSTMAIEVFDEAAFPLVRETTVMFDRFEAAAAA